MDRKKLKAHAKGAWKSWTMRFAIVLGLLPDLLPLLQSQWPDLAPFIPDALESRVMSAIALLVGYFRMRTNRPLATRGNAAVVLLALMMLPRVTMAAAPSILEEGGGWSSTMDATIQACVPNGACGPLKSVPAGTFQHCPVGLTLPANPAGVKLECRAYVGAPPVVPPAIPPAVPTLAYQDVCLPELKADFWNIEYETGDVPVSVGSQYQRYVVWRGRADCPGGRFIYAQLYSNSELAEFVKQRFKSDSDVNTWAKSQEVIARTAEESVFLSQVLATYKAKLSPPAPTPPPAPPPPAQPSPPPPAFAVAKDGTKPTRPVYAVVNGARRTTASGALAAKVGDVAVGSPCNCVKLSTDAGKYCSVEGQPKYGTTTPLPASTVALCEVK